MKEAFLSVLVLVVSSVLYGQNSDSSQPYVSGAVSVTNNGVSLVPAFSLKAPAVVFDVAIRRKKFSFEPELAFGFKDVKPWYFVFWLRYKLIEKQKFKMGVGFHPGFLFTTTRLPVNGVDKEYFTTSRYFVGELSPTYTLGKNFTAGLYYQHSRGFNSQLRQSNFVGINGTLTNLRLFSDYYLRLQPQFYYLKNDDRDGTYVSTVATISKKAFPFSISTLLNQKIKSNIPSDDLIWNIALTYTY